MSIFICLLVSIGKGFILSGFIYLLGEFMDNTIGRESYNTILETKRETYDTGKKYVQQNLLFISPIAYSFVDYNMLQHNMSFSFFKFIGLIFIENIGYYCAHLEMHNNLMLYWIHKFHHKFDVITIPSIAHAVTHYEFLLAYLSPLIVGAFILEPSELEFSMAILMISISNLFIHTHELKNVRWIPGLVSPFHHIEHHNLRNKHYAAPILNIDKIMDNE